MATQAAAGAARAVDCGGPDFGFNLGTARTTADGFDDSGFTGNATVECFGRTFSPWGILGLTDLASDLGGGRPNATYGFLGGGMIAGRHMFYGMASAGVYHVTLDDPIVPETSRSLEFGYSGGGRFLLPLGHNAGVAFEALLHRVRGDGPTNVLTFTVGIFFW